MSSGSRSVNMMMNAARRVAVCLAALSMFAVCAVSAQPLAAPALDPVPLADLSGFPQAPDNWRIAGDAWTVWDSTALVLEPGSGVLVNLPEDGHGGHLFTPWEHGDLELELDYLMPKGSNSGLYLQGRYEVQLFDSWGVERPRFSDAGGIYRRYDPERPEGQTEFEGHAPRKNASRAPGLWQHLRIVFQAPRFDEAGRKTANARIVEVVHNGLKVQENVEVTGPTREAAYEDEQPTGPLMIQGDHGAVAFRNIRFRHYAQAEPVTVSGVRYRFYPGEFSSLADFEDAEPARSGESYGFVWNHFGATADRFGARWEGVIQVPRAGEYDFGVGLNWIDEIPYEEDAVPGTSRLTIDGRTVVDHTGAEQFATGRIHLEEGEHPFTLDYFKNRRLWRSIVWLRVEAPGMAPQFLNAPRTLPEPETSSPPMAVDPARRPFVLRSFVEHGGEKKTNAVSVGDPQGVHYALDLDHGGLLYAWKGDFADVGSMWTGRGQMQVASPLGQRIDFSGGPALAFLPDAASPWPATLAEAGYRFKGYALDAEGRPAFRYEIGGVRVSDRFLPEQDGRILKRRLSLTGASSPKNLWLRIADGMEVQSVGPGIYRVDGSYFVSFDTGAAPRLRAVGGRQELLVPVRLDSGAADFSYSIIW